MIAVKGEQYLSNRRHAHAGPNQYLTRSRVQGFEIVACVPLKKYTDRFFLPLGGKMDWVHTITEVEGGSEVTFDVSAMGPTSFILGPIMRNILGRELPPTVDKLVAIAEQA